jgi:putative ABC transport system ATP-binding protein
MRAIACRPGYRYDHAMLTIRNLSKSFTQPEGVVRVLDALNFEMKTSSSIALLGESGSGKSTLLHLIAGLDKPDSGEILIAGQKLGD